MFVDNFKGHDYTEPSFTSLQRLNAAIRFLPPNCTDKLQPCDSFVISKIKDAWRDEWEAYKLKACQCENEFQIEGKKDRKSSRAIKNPGKRFFFKLAANSIKKVNSSMDAYGLSFT